MPERLSVWRKAGPDRKVNSVTAERLSKKVVRIDTKATLPAKPYSYRFRLSPIPGNVTSLGDMSRISFDLAP